MSDDGGNWIGDLSDSAWETISEHKGAIGVFGGFFWMVVFTIREGNQGVRLLPYLALAAGFFSALCVISLAIERPVDRLLKRVIGNNESSPVLAGVFGLILAWIFLFVWLFWITYRRFLL
jgi:hypothetical protein